MTVPASIFTVTDVDEGIVVSVNEGIVKFFGCQSSMKKPMVVAVGGSVGSGSEGGIMGKESTGGAGGGAAFPGFFLQEKIIVKKAISAV